jgi:hypothetical protein
MKGTDPVRGDADGRPTSRVCSLADHLERLGDVRVSHITFESEPTDWKDDLRFTVYYHREPRRR